MSQVKIYLIAIFLYHSRRKILFKFRIFSVRKLSRRILSDLNGINFVYCMSRRIILRQHGSSSSYRCLQCGLLLSRLGKHLFELCIWNICIICIIDQLLKLSRGNLPSLNRICCMSDMYRRIVLCHDRSYCSDGHLQCGLIFGGSCDRLFKLLIRKIFRIVFLYQLLELSCWNLSGLHGVFFMYSLPWRIVLRYFRSNCNDGCLRNRILLKRLRNCMLELFTRSVFIICIINELLKLSRGNISGVIWIRFMRGMSRWIVLCIYGSDSCDSCMHCGVLLNGIGNCMFKLFIWIIYINCIIDQLLELSGGNLPDLNRVHFVYDMYRRIILFHFWS